MERLSGHDATFIYTETARTPFEIGSLLVLDTRGRSGGELDLQRLREQLVNRLGNAPRMRQRVQRVPMDLHHPVWVDDHRFDIEYHVRQSRVAEPGRPEDLARLVGSLLSSPLDRSRPLWELYLIEGLAEGRSAIFVKTHHAAFDGLSGMQVLTTLVDLEPDPEPTPAPDEWVPGGRPSAPGLLLGAGADLLRRPWAVPLEVARLGLGLLGTLVTPTTASQVIGASMAPPSPFNRRLSGQRTVRFFEVDLTEVKRIKDTERVKLNDVALCLVGGGLRRYLERHEVATDPSLLAYMPITLRAGEEALGNYTSVVSARIGTDEPDPIARLRMLAKQTVSAKRRASAMRPPLILDVSAVTGPVVGPLIERLAVAARLTEALRLAGNLVVSNVASIPVPLYALGSLVEEAYPIGPITDGVGLNFTLLSYRDKLAFSMLTEPGVVSDPDALVDDCIAAFAELGAAVKVKRLKAL